MQCLTTDLIFLILDYTSDVIVAIFDEFDKGFHDQKSWILHSGTLVEANFTFIPCYPSRLPQQYMYKLQYFYKLK